MKILKILSISISLALLVSGSVFGDCIKVPRDHETIQEAIDAANDGDCILVSPGRYEENVNFQGKEIKVRSTDGPGSTTITEGTQFETGEPAGTELDGFTLLGANHGFFEDAKPTIRNCIFLGTVAFTGGSGSIDASSPTFIDCEIRNGDADLGGGFDVRNGSNATFERCIFINNRANQGGGLYVDSSSTATILNSTFRDNTVSENLGGGIFNLGNLNVNHSTIEQNTALGGGGIYNRGGSVNIADSLVVSNDGGGVVNEDGTLSVANSTIAMNVGLDGAGIVSSSAGPSLTITNSTIADNIASRNGGGIVLAAIFFQNTEATIINTTIANNTAAQKGGGIYLGALAPFPPTVNIINSTISGNSASEGGGIFDVNAEREFPIPSLVQLQNTILAENVATSSRGPDCVGAPISLGNNIVGDGTLDLAVCRIDLLSTDIVGDPGLDDFIGDGTPGNGHFPLLPTSSAIDTGNDAACPSTDQLGIPRPVDGDVDGTATCDIGAIEFGFRDIPPGFWAEDHIYAIFNEGITKGCSQNPLMYCPKKDVTREQMAAFLVRAVEGEPDANYCATGSSFSDVSPASLFCKYIKRLSELGITKGCGGNNYCPKTTVKRDQMAAFLVRAVEGEPDANYCAAGSPFPDVDPASGFCKYIKRLSELGITKGCGGGNYCPKRTVKRDQMAVFLARAFLGMN